MNFWRGLIVGVWLMLHVGGYVFVAVMRAQMVRWQDMGAELPALTVQAIVVADLFVKYWYVFSILATLACVALWRAGNHTNKHSERPD